MNAGFQAQQANSMGSGVVCQMIEQRLPETESTKVRAHIHTLDFPIRTAKQLDAATAGGSILIAQHEKRDRLRNQLFDAIAVTAFDWIEWGQMRFQLSNQDDGV